MKIASFNCHSLKSSGDAVRDLCDKCDIVLLQETWLNRDELSVLNNIHPDCYGMGTSAIDIESDILVGRPYGGLAILWKRKIAHEIKIVQYNDSRLLGLECQNSTGAKLFVLNAYLPYKCDNNFEDFCMYLGKIDSIIESVDTPYSIVMGDFNADPRSSFGRELVTFAEDQGYVLSDMIYFKDNPSVFTYVSDAHGTTSWLDHCMCTKNANDLITSLEISDKYICSDHMALVMCCDWHSAPKLAESVPNTGDKCFRWGDVDDETVKQYELNTSVNLEHIKLPEACHCTDTNCDNKEHLIQIETLYSDIISALIDASDDVIPSSGASKKGKHNIVGWNDIVKDSHERAREAFLLWQTSNKPRHGLVYELMRTTRAQFKYSLRHCRRQEETLKADAIVKALLNKNSKEFWKGVSKARGKVDVLASTIDNVSGESDIAEMWGNNYSQLFNSVTNNTHENTVRNSIANIDNTYEEMVVSSETVNRCIKSLDCGKAPGPDKLSAEHYKYADSRLSVYLAVSFTTMLTHGYLPADSIVTTLVPIIKNKRGDITDKNNYRPIALATVFSKLFEKVVLELCKEYLYTCENQFGFKQKLGTDQCIFALKEIVNYYSNLSSPVFICFLDASKAFDRVNHWLLFKKLIDRKVPLFIVRLLCFWYTNQKMNVKWGAAISNTFSVHNGVKQGGILSPLLFCVYMDDLAVKLNNSGIGCHYGGRTLNHLICP